MSHWKSGKLDLKCSLAILRRALLKIMPQWEQFMQTSDEGGLSIHNYYTDSGMKGYHLKIALKSPTGQKAPGFSYADIGFKRESDGSWSTDIDESYIRLDEVKTLQGAVKREVGAMKAQAQARAKGGKVVSVQTSGGRTKVVMDIPVDDKYKIHA
ncbi:hypothetical protein D4R86_02955 [bacterium]|nr:MAG: hypothetical protein D4R86_02955 [bacterium]